MRRQTFFMVKFFSAATEGWKTGEYVWIDIPVTWPYEKFESIQLGSQRHLAGFDGRNGFHVVESTYNQVLRSFEGRVFKVWDNRKFLVHKGE